MIAETCAGPTDPAGACAPGIAAAVVVDAGCRLLFVVLDHRGDAGADWRREIHRRAAAAGMAPDAVIAAPDLPRAADGRLLPQAARRMLGGERARAVAELERVANPESLEFFARLFQNL